MERIVINKMNYLAQRGYQITVITTEQKNKSSFFYLNPSIKCIDLNINYGDDNNKELIVKFIKFIHKQHIHKKRLRKILYKIKADIVISTFGNEINFLSQIKDGSKKILEIHFSKYFRVQLQRKGWWKLVDLYRSYIDNRKIKQYDKFVVLTNEDKQFWGNIKNIEVIPNYISLPLNNTNTSSTENRAIAVGRLSFQKGYERMLKAWSIVHEQFPSWKLDIFGEGEEKVKILSLIKELKLEEVVNLHAPTPNIQKEYERSSIFLLSSRYEGFPMVLLEAMAYQLPIITFDCKCGPKDLIDNETDGILVKEGNINEFANKIIELIKYPEKRKFISHNCTKKISMFTEEVIMQRWIQLFSNIISLSK